MQHFCKRLPKETTMTTRFTPQLTAVALALALPASAQSHSRAEVEILAQYYAQYYGVPLELVRRGYTPEQIDKIWSGNLLRVWEQVEKVAGMGPKDSMRE